MWHELKRPGNLLAGNLRDDAEIAAMNLADEVLEAAAGLPEESGELHEPNSVARICGMPSPGINGEHPGREALVSGPGQEGPEIGQVSRQQDDPGLSADGTPEPGEGTDRQRCGHHHGEVQVGEKGWDRDA